MTWWFGIKTFGWRRFILKRLKFLISYVLQQDLNHQAFALMHRQMWAGALWGFLQDPYGADNYPSASRVCSFKANPLCTCTARPCTKFWKLFEVTWRENFPNPQDRAYIYLDLFLENQILGEGENMKKLKINVLQFPTMSHIYTYNLGFHFLLLLSLHLKLWEKTLYLWNTQKYCVAPLLCLGVFSSRPAYKGRGWLFH